MTCNFRLYRTILSQADPLKESAALRWGLTEVTACIQPVGEQEAVSVLGCEQGDALNKKPLIKVSRQEQAHFQDHSEQNGSKEKPNAERGLPREAGKTLKYIIL